MYTSYFFLAEIFTLIIIIHGQDNVEYPNFPSQAEFLIEQITLDGQQKRTYDEYIYDFDNNYLIKINEDTYEYSNYTILKKAIYSINNLQQCNVYPIDLQNPSDGFSAVIDPNDNTTHIQPLYELLGLTSQEAYQGESVLRGFIHVDQWLSYISNETDRIWSFAKANYSMPWNSTVYSVPIQRITKRKTDGFISEVLNVFNYKTQITKTDLSRPKGVFCHGFIPDDQLIKLEDFGIKLPDKFSIRVDASTSVQQLWHTAHLYYHVTSERKLIRYDYKSFDNTLNPMTIILDDTQDAPRLYTIDRRTGSCMINETSGLLSFLSILRQPIESLIKYNDFFLSTAPKLFQYTGTSPCRGSILCANFIGQMAGFPIDLDDDWLFTNIGWGWSKRYIDNKNSSYDYPVYLDLSLNKGSNEPPANVHYEFYDYRTDIDLNEFDVSLCYRSNQLRYQHLAFQLRIVEQATTDGIEFSSINRRLLNERIRAQMTKLMPIKYLRISQLEIDHNPKQLGHNDTIYCVFTLLDRTPFVNPASEIELVDAKNHLQNGINSGQFKFSTDDGFSIEAIPGSLEDFEYFYAFNPNASVNQIDYFFNTTVHVNRTIIEVIEQVHEKTEYADGAQAGAVIGGTFIGALCGLLTVVAVMLMMKRKAETTRTGGIHFRNISFRFGKKQKQDIVTIENTMENIQETFT